MQRRTCCSGLARSLRALGGACALGAVCALPLAACADDAVDCAGPGVYSRGKEGGPICCPDLNAYHRMIPYRRDSGELVCDEPFGHAVFGCTEGTCGDGRCELGEQGECGCSADCGADSG